MNDYISWEAALAAGRVKTDSCYNKNCSLVRWAPNTTGGYRCECSYTCPSFVGRPYSITYTINTERGHDD